MKVVETLDAAWLAAHPLPALDGASDKNGRGQLLVVGGSPSAPAAPALTAEAALRAGAGRVRIAVAETMAPHLAALLPEAGIIALPVRADGELSPRGMASFEDDLVRADAIVIGPGMGDRAAAARIVKKLLGNPRDGLSILLDAAACACAGPLATVIAEHRGRVLLTPHPGEMAELMGIAVEQVADEQQEIARAAAVRFGAVVALRSVETIVATPDGRAVRYAGGGIGLATGGSGDVAAGIAGGLLARGVDPFTAAAWAVWLHGEAGKRAGPVGFLARELLPFVPGLIAETSRARKLS